MLFDPLVSYSAGLRGCEASPRSDEELVDHIIRHGGDPDGGHVASEWEFADRGKGKLTMLFPAVEKVFPSAFPGPAQLTGDCVSRAAANCLLVSVALASLR